MFCFIISCNDNFSSLLCFVSLCCISVCCAFFYFLLGWVMFNNFERGKLYCFVCHVACLCVILPAAF